ncbi:hypothetical protein [Natronorubrum sp. FCH18a]|uniref:hypothetical protein n=1 Tax=Natronorubrum sp. FCH18a TaxID=3447018 RepID=UPI003F514641
MKRILIFATTVALLAAMGMGMGMGSAIAAQENTTNSSDQADGELEGANESAVSPNEDFVREIDSDTRIVDWSYNPGMFEIVIEADEGTRVSVTEAGDFEEGAGSFNYEEFDVEEGNNTITMPVTDRQGAGVAIATRRSLEQGGGATLSIGQVEQNPFRHFGGESGLFSGVLMTVGMAGGGSWYVIRSEESGVIEA